MVSETDLKCEGAVQNSSAGPAARLPDSQGGFEATFSRDGAIAVLWWFGGEGLRTDQQDRGHGGPRAWPLVLIVQKGSSGS
jgi:hypothetical protein